MRMRTTAWVLMAGAVALAAAGPSLAKNNNQERGRGKDNGARNANANSNGHGHDDDDDDDDDHHHGDDRPQLTFEARLSGFLETPVSISSTGKGKLKIRLNAAESSAEYELTYSELEGTTVAAAHIHLGQPGTSGGVMVVLCSNPAQGTTPACPGPAGGTVTGTLVAADVVGPTAQGVAAGEFAEFVKALRKRAAYVNVHTDLYPSGEIRGNVH